MSKILRRPMFRGGKVIDSRGTGITSGLMDTPSYAIGGRVGFNTGGDFLSKLLGTDTRGYGKNNIILGGELYPQSSTTDVPAMKDYLGTSRNILDQEKDVVVGSDGDVIQKTTEDIFEEDRIQKEADQKKADAMGVTVAEMKAIERENLSTSGVEDIEKEKAILTQPNLSKSNGEIKTEISAKDLIRENSELFKELLSEGQKEDIKKARIQDASDYLLKFFEGSQKEGATVGSSAADVAAFATSRDSKTEKAKASIEKGDQTAIALAINDYIAGNRSKEQIEMLQAKMGINFANQIALIDYKNKKNNFFDNFKENRKSMNQSKALIFTIKETFGKNAKNVDDGANITFKENIGEYFIFPDGSVRTVIEDSNGKLVEDILIGSGG